METRGYFHQDDLERSRAQITSFLLGDDGLGGELFPEQVLDEDEKCSLYYMLSHVVNITALPDELDAYMTVRLMSSFVINDNQDFI